MVLTEQANQIYMWSVWIHNKKPCEHGHEQQKLFASFHLFYQIKWREMVLLWESPMVESYLLFASCQFFKKFSNSKKSTKSLFHNGWVAPCIFIQTLSAPYQLCRHEHKYMICMLLFYRYRPRRQPTPSYNLTEWISWQQQWACWGFWVTYRVTKC